MASIDKEKILIEEIKLVQDIIKRMASNSFNVKTWAVTLVAATLLIKGNSNHTFIAFIPLFAFWFLDAYYLQQERLYRELHKWIIKYRMDHDDDLFNMSTTKFKYNVQSVVRIMFSISIFPFYFGILILLIAYIFIANTDHIKSFFECIQFCLNGVTNGK